MKILLYTMVLLVIAGCRTVRKSASSTTVSKDSTMTLQSVHKQDSNALVRFTERKDTTISIPSREVSATFQKEDLQPVYTKDGAPVGRTFTERGRGISAEVSVGPQGDVSVKCSADSLTLVIAGLTRQYEQLYSSYDSLRIMNMLTYREHQQDTSTSETRIASFWASVWPYLLGVAIVILLVLAAIGIFRERKTFF